MHFLSLGLLALAGHVCAAPLMSNATTVGNSSKAMGAFYFSINGLNGTKIIASSIGMDGSLSSSVAYDAHGIGANGDTSPAPPSADNLFSQGAVCVSGKTLLMVNAGSNTVSMFTIDDYNPTQLAYVNTVSSRGEFPLSVTASADTNSACVFNGGNNGSVSCYRIHMNGLVPIGDSFQALNLNQTNPPKGPPGTGSQIAFSSNGELLYVTVKGNPMTNATGYVNTYTMVSGVMQNATTVNTGAMSLPFGFVETPNNGLMISDAGYGFDVMELKNLMPMVTDAYNISGQMASCWVSYSSRTKSYYIIDTALPRFYEATVDDSTGKGTLIKTWPSLSILTDSAIASTPIGDFMYIIHGPTHGIVMYSLQGKGALTEMGVYNVTGLGLGRAEDFVGAATYVL